MLAGTSLAGFLTQVQLFCVLVGRQRETEHMHTSLQDPESFSKAGINKKEAKS
jgi:hypothetical protein